MIYENCVCTCVSACECVRRWQLRSGSSCTQLHTPRLSQGCPGSLMERPTSSTKPRPTPGTGVEHLGWDLVTVYCPCMRMERDRGHQAKVGGPGLIMGQQESRQGQKPTVYPIGSTGHIEHEFRKKHFFVGSKKHARTQLLLNTRQSLLMCSGQYICSCFGLST